MRIKQVKGIESGHLSGDSIQTVEELEIKQEAFELCLK